MSTDVFIKVYGAVGLLFTIALSTVISRKNDKSVVYSVLNIFVVISLWPLFLCGMPFFFRAVFNDIENTREGLTDWFREYLERRDAKNREQ